MKSTPIIITSLILLLISCSESSKKNSPPSSFFDRNKGKEAQVTEPKTVITLTEKEEDFAHIDSLESRYWTSKKELEQLQQAGIPVPVNEITEQDIETLQLAAATSDSFEILGDLSLSINQMLRKYDPRNAILSDEDGGKNISPLSAEEKKSLTSVQQTLLQERLTMEKTLVLFPSSYTLEGVFLANHSWTEILHLSVLNEREVLQENAIELSNKLDDGTLKKSEVKSILDQLTKLDKKSKETISKIDLLSSTKINFANVITSNGDILSSANFSLFNDQDIIEHLQLMKDIQLQQQAEFTEAFQGLNDLLNQLPD